MGKIDARAKTLQYVRSGARALTARLRRLPDAIIVGAMKCGTTSLFYALANHPEILPSTAKEVHFFDREFERGVNWYRRHFALKRKGVVVESTPKYMFHEASLPRMKRLLPNCKIIAILRDPVERAFSHYQHMRREHDEPRSFEEVIATDVSTFERAGPFCDDDVQASYCSYVRRGIYAPQLIRFRDAFDGKLLVLRSETFFADPTETIKQVCDFLEIDSRLEVVATPRNTGSYSAEIPLRKQLNAFYAPYNRVLYQEFGLDEWWPY